MERLHCSNQLDLQVEENYLPTKLVEEEEYLIQSYQSVPVEMVLPLLPLEEP